jgi:hypothetical protein
MAVPPVSFGKHVRSTQNIIHNAESHPTNFPATEHIWILCCTDVGLRKASTASTSSNSRHGSSCTEKKIPEPVCEELQLLNVSVLPLSGEFSMKSHFTQRTASECKCSLLLTIVEGRSFACGVTQKCVVNIQFAANILFIDKVGFTRERVL